MKEIAGVKPALPWEEAGVNAPGYRGKKAGVSAPGYRGKKAGVSAPGYREEEKSSEEGDGNGYTIRQ